MDKMTGKFVTCTACGKKVYRKPCHLQAKEFFCSLTCKKLGHSTPCEQCGKPAYFKLSELKTLKHHFCSRLCWKIYKRGKSRPAQFTGINTHCMCCGKDIYVIKSRIRKNNFCSIKCCQKWAKGINSYAWHGGKSFEPYGIDFNNKRKEERRKIDNYRCQQCFRQQDELFTRTGKSVKLAIHHIDYNKQNNSIENLISLCPNCHAQTNFKREDWINYFKDRH